MVETWRNWVLKTLDLQVDMKRSYLLETVARLASLTSAQRRSTFRPSTPPQLYYTALMYQVTARSEASLVDLSWLPPSSRLHSSPPPQTTTATHTSLTEYNLTADGHEHVYARSTSTDYTCQICYVSANSRETVMESSWNFHMPKIWSSQWPDNLKFSTVNAKCNQVCNQEVGFNSKWLLIHVLPIFQVLVQHSKHYIKCS